MVCGLTSNVITNMHTCIVIVVCNNVAAVVDVDRTFQVNRVCLDLQEPQVLLVHVDFSVPLDSVELEVHDVVTVFIRKHNISRMP